MMIDHHQVLTVQIEGVLADQKRLIRKLEGGKERQVLVQISIGSLTLKY
jgi:hypothetical protein